MRKRKVPKHTVELTAQEEEALVRREIQLGRCVLALARAVTAVEESRELMRTARHLGVCMREDCYIPSRQALRPSTARLLTKR